VWLVGFSLKLKPHPTFEIPPSKNSSANTVYNIRRLAYLSRDVARYGLRGGGLNTPSPQNKYCPLPKSNEAFNPFGTGHMFFAKLHII